VTVRRAALLFSIAALMASACGGPGSGPRPVAPPLAARASAPEVLAIADAIVDDQLAESPDLETRLRPPGARYDHLPGDSLADFAAREAREDQWRATLASVDRSTLGTSPAGLAYDIADETLAARKQARVCRYELWSVRQMGGFQVQFADLAQSQPVGTPELRAQALARFTKVPLYVTTQIANLREGLRLGYAQNDGNVKQVIEQLDRLTAGGPEESPFFRPAASDPEAAFRTRWRALVESEITPSLVKYRAFLRDEYLPHARASFAVSANPNGAECYRASIRLYTTVPMDAKAIHESGLAELAHIEQEMTALSAKSFGGASVRTLLERFAREPAYLHKDAADVTALATAAVTRAQAALPRAFGILPTAAVVIDPIPKYQERTAAAHYRPAALDGSEPAAYRIRLYEPEKTSVVLGESTAFHETVPGHHLQINIGNARRENPRIARFLFNSGFGEGWALYAERLADELGLYSNDASRMGMLSNAAWRACRLIVDSGLHAFGWDRDRAIALMLEHTAMSPAQAAQEVDRYISWPGQATSYMTGYLEIARLRAEAEKGLGARFDRKQFHDRVLENGAVPLPVLRRRIQAWITASR
jgi:uncharacterized protein (DUF885 family)